MPRFTLQRSGQKKGLGDVVPIKVYKHKLWRRGWLGWVQHRCGQHERLRDRRFEGRIDLGVLRDDPHPLFPCPVARRRRLGLSNRVPLIGL